MLKHYEPDSGSQAQHRQMLASANFYGSKSKVPVWGWLPPSVVISSLPFWVLNDTIADLECPKENAHKEAPQAILVRCDLQFS